jgi:hypothetical protein
MIDKDLLKKGTSDAYKALSHQDRAWGDMRLRLPHEERGFGVIHNTVSRHNTVHVYDERQVCRLPGHLASPAQQVTLKRLQEDSFRTATAQASRLLRPAGGKRWGCGEADAAGGAAKKEPRSVCPHQRQRGKCKDCGGAGFCQHQRRRSRCKECWGASICQHQRERIERMECRGAGICPHQRRKSICKVCGGRRASASTSAEGASARSTGARASARSSAERARARSVGGGASARTSASGADVRSSGRRCCGLVVGRRWMTRCLSGWRSSEKVLKALV